MSVDIRPFRRSLDLADAADLWHAELSPGWPVLPGGLDLLRRGHVARHGGQLVGLVAIDRAGSVTFVAVASAYRRRGIGTRLLEHAIADLRRVGRTVIKAGSGGASYIWPGVPTDCREGLAFFDVLGWTEEYVATDLTQDLSVAGVGRGLARFSPPAGVSVRLATPRDADAVLEFEAQRFPSWKRWFLEAKAETAIATDSTGAVVGALLLEGPGRASKYWPVLGTECGSIACVGVAPSDQNHGVGSSLVAFASRVLADRGVGICHIGWVVRVRVGFYERLGYQTWRRYSVRKLAN